MIFHAGLTRGSTRLNASATTRAAAPPVDSMRPCPGCSHISVCGTGEGCNAPQTIAALS